VNRHLSPYVAGSRHCGHHCPLRHYHPAVTLSRPQTVRHRTARRSAGPAISEPKLPTEVPAIRPVLRRGRQRSVVCDLVNVDEHFTAEQVNWPDSWADADVNHRTVGQVERPVLELLQTQFALHGDEVQVLHPNEEAATVCFVVITTVEVNALKEGIMREQVPECYPLAHVMRDALNAKTYLKRELCWLSSDQTCLGKELQTCLANANAKPRVAGQRPVTEAWR
jgi:hypothetical protein